MKHPSTRGCGKLTLHQMQVRGVGAIIGRKSRQGGVVLIICLVLLAVISLTAAVSVSGAANSEAVANNTRKQTIAQQSAEAALLHCERLVEKYVVNSATGKAPAAAPATVNGKYNWEDLKNWDGSASAGKITIVPFADSASSAVRKNIKRSPECMAQYFGQNQTNTFIVTARGFGPEVSAPDTGRKAPVGTEIWLQSVVKLN